MDLCLELPSAPSLFCPELNRLFLTGGLKQQDKFQMEPFTITVASTRRIRMCSVATVGQQCPSVDGRASIGKECHCEEP